MRTTKTQHAEKEGKESRVARLTDYPSDDFRYQDFSSPEPQTEVEEPEIVLDPDTPCRSTLRRSSGR